MIVPIRFISLCLFYFSWRKEMFWSNNAGPEAIMRVLEVTMKVLRSNNAGLGGENAMILWEK